MLNTMRATLRSWRGHVVSRLRLFTIFARRPAIISSIPLEKSVHRMQAGVTARRHAADPLEVAREVTLIGEPHSSSHLNGGDPRLQQGASAFDPQSNLVCVRRQANISGERPQQVKATQLREGCELFQTHGHVEMSIEMIPHTLDRAQSPRITCGTRRTDARGPLSDHLGALRQAVELAVTLVGPRAPSHDEILTNHDCERR
jgi:hypothetical protein